ncbi:carbamoyl phosphate synthase small subunit [Lactobacillus sp. LC28-10]|uniref:Carbamoyl phosphate synthase small chain n=1 Tax=Secundilactobacillus angelensis TaxID=2722706 RepID=A0ABX1KVW7_9LACO|nr:carbamoyl phosphate synthase small subunit [Secundilactobacillus angelensis]MCH5462446.1 carbamoyl phosphate synthase small subunit [Secundilactobacillus angelensis]NLR18072.1 carbamoyl phosphate synthase small subunit [Secundilactobacillus angelensis]
MKKYLTLENGDQFVGTAVGDLTKEIKGELVFTTSMVGYQETLTDPSYTNQIITFTYPLIGNYGISLHANQSPTVAASAVVMQELASTVFHYQSVMTLDEFLKKSNVPGIAGVDTRQLTKIIRKHGTMKASLTNQPLDTSSFNKTQSVDMIVKSATFSHPEDEKPDHVVLVDFGVKANIVEFLKNFGANVTVVTPEATFESIEALNPDGILLSNGPGDPEEFTDFLPVIRQLQEHYPLFGICLGHQLLALANGARTYKMVFGHRGINHPVKNLLTDEVIITSQNHGYAVDIDSVSETPLEVTAVEINDHTCEGLRYPGKPVFSVQYHPEAAPGPHEATRLFSKFMGLMNTNGGVQHA